MSGLEYERVAQIIERQIDGGSLRARERVPSLRAMSRHAGVSIGTVVQAYLQLERRGLIETRPRSGYFVAQRRAAELPSPSGKKIAPRRPLGVAREVMDTVLESFGRTDLVALNSALAAAAGRVNGRLNGLTRATLRETPGLPNVLSPAVGYEPLRREIAKRMALVGMRVGHEDIVITNGTMEALALSLGVLCEPGDAVLVESPTYFGILQLLQHLRLKVVEVPSNADTGIDVAAVEAALARTKVAAAVLQSSFNNPTGAVTPDAAKKRIVALLAKRGVPLIEDDIYGDLHYGNERPQPFGAFDDSGGVVTCGSLSKSVAIGYRIGWAISTRHTMAIARAKFCGSVATVTLQQHVAARYYAAGQHDRHLRRVCAELSANCGRFAAAIAKWFPKGTRVSNPAGGVVLWVELPNGADGVELFHAALEHGIGVAPGIIFSAKADYRNFIRLSAGVQWTAAIENALRMLGRLAGTARGARRDSATRIVRRQSSA
jgi:DNA-binding transcriptional MocR family regulator